MATIPPAERGARCPPQPYNREAPVRIHAPAKVNLALLVGPTDETGLHTVDSLFHFLELGDTVTVEPADTLSLTCDVDLGIAPEQNLAYRAAESMGQRFGFEPNVAIHIEKRIPHGAGMGGGSTDAAAVILALASLNNLHPRSPEVLEFAATLGADVPVFLVEQGAPIMTGHGEKFVRAAQPATGLPVVIAKPAGVVSPTSEVYRVYDSMPYPPHSISPAVEAFETMVAQAPGGEPGTEWDRGVVFDFGHRIVNGLQLAAMRVEPEVHHVKVFLAEQREVLGSMVSGSGAASFALCATDKAATDVAARADRRGIWAIATRLASEGVHVV